MAAVNINLEWTPNPSTLKYVVDRRLLPSGAVNMTSREAAVEKSPLAVKLMDITGIIAVMVGTTFVTITKGEHGEWDEVNDQVMATLSDYLGADLPVVNEGALQRTVAADGTVAGRIQEILDAEIRPAVAQDGGDITLDRVEGGTVYLHMTGSCAGCPSSTATLKMGIESRLRELIPEVNEVVAV